MRALGVARNSSNRHLRFHSTPTGPFPVPHPEFSKSGSAVPDGGGAPIVSTRERD